MTNFAPISLIILILYLYYRTISIQNNLPGALFQNQSLIGAKEFLSVLASFCQTPDAVFAQGRFEKRLSDRPARNVSN
jgi:hypothetical protein